MLTWVGRHLGDFLFGAGGLAVLYGCFLVAPWLAWIVGGVLLMVLSALLALPRRTP